MSRTTSDKNPFKIRAVVRRDRLKGEAVKWYDRARWLQAKALQIPPNERTAYQHNVDMLWKAVDLFEKGEDASVNAARLEQLFGSFFTRWSLQLGEEPPHELG